MPKLQNLDPSASNAEERHGRPSREAAQELYATLYAEPIEQFQWRMGESVSPDAASLIRENAGGLLTDLKVSAQMSQGKDEADKRDDDSRTARDFGGILLKISEAVRSGRSEAIILGVQEGPAVIAHHREAQRQGHSTYTAYHNQGVKIVPQAIDRVYHLLGVTRSVNAHGNPYDTPAEGTTYEHDEDGKVIAVQTVTPAGVTILEKWTVSEPDDISGLAQRPEHVPLKSDHHSGMGTTEHQSEVHSITFFRTPPQEAHRL